MKAIKDICYGDCVAQSLDVYLPDMERFPVFVYFHGGGLEHGDKSDPQALFCDLAAKGIAVVTANYRMYPDARYPEFLQDSARAVAWVKDNMPAYGTVEGIYVGGSSAGGYISQMLCFDPTYYAEYGVQSTDIAGYVHDAGQPTCHFNVLRERGLDTRRVIIDESAPIYHIRADQAYPPMLIIVSDNDLQNRYEQTVLLQSTLNHFGYGDRVQLQLMHGTHCAYVVNAEDGAFSDLISGFILGK